jgi:hypothetical protein
VDEEGRLVDRSIHRSSRSSSTAAHHHVGVGVAVRIPDRSGALCLLQVLLAHADIPRSRPRGGRGAAMARAGQAPSVL